MKVWSYVTLAMKLMPLVTDLVVIAEKLFDDVPESGADKKAMVMSGIKSVFSAMISVSTGGQQDTWSRLEPFVSQIVDSICSVLFPDAEEKPLHDIMD
jgi:hypothetical protein